MKPANGFVQAPENIEYDYYFTHIEYAKEFMNKLIVMGYVKKGKYFLFCVSS